MPWSCRVARVTVQLPCCGRWRREEPDVLPSPPRLDFVVVRDPSAIIHPVLVDPGPERCVGRGWEVEPRGGSGRPQQLPDHGAGGVAHRRLDVHAVDGADPARPPADDAQQTLVLREVRGRGVQQPPVEDQSGGGLAPHGDRALRLALRRPIVKGLVLSGNTAEALDLRSVAIAGAAAQVRAWHYPRVPGVGLGAVGEVVDRLHRHAGGRALGELEAAALAVGVQTRVAMERELFGLPLQNAERRRRAGAGGHAARAGGEGVEEPDVRPDDVHDLGEDLLVRDQPHQLRHELHVVHAAEERLADVLVGVAALLRARRLEHLRHAPLQLREVGRRDRVLDDLCAPSAERRR